MMDFHTHLIFMKEVKDKERWDKVGKYFIYLDSKYPFGTRSMAEIEARMDFGGIDRIVVLPVDCERIRGEALLTNEEVKLLCGHSQRLIGFASVDPVKATVLDDLADANAMGLVGLKLDPGLQGFRLSDHLDHPMWKMVEGFHWPVVLHSGFTFAPGVTMYGSKLEEIEQLALRYPGINFVVAHWAFPWVMESVLIAIKNPNVFIDVSMAYFDNPRTYSKFILEKMISPSIAEKSVREKLIFGSNYPRVRMESLKSAYEAWPISDKAKRYLFEDNAARLLNTAHRG